MERLRLGSRNWAQTIVAVGQPGGVQDMGVMASDRPAADAPQVVRDVFKIRLAHDAERSRDARFLVERRYRDAGYHVGATPGEQVCPERITLATYKGEEVVGTLTVGFDTGYGLLADELYQIELNRLRLRDRRVCEFTKLAINSRRASKRMMAGLFHVAYLYAARIWGYTDVVIEVNPDHVSFYQRMLGFEQIGEERICPRVGAPARLLWLDLERGGRLVERFGGHPELAGEERSLYPYFMPADKEQEILARMARS